MKPEAQPMSQFSVACIGTSDMRPLYGLMEYVTVHYRSGATRTEGRIVKRFGALRPNRDHDAFGGVFRGWQGAI
jgi:hypothetical protein